MARRTGDIYLEFADGIALLFPHFLNIPDCSLSFHLPFFQGQGAPSLAIPLLFVAKTNNLSWGWYFGISRIDPARSGYEANQYSPRSSSDLFMVRHSFRCLRLPILCRLTLFSFHELQTLHETSASGISRHSSHSALRRLILSWSRMFGALIQNGRSFSLGCSSCPILT